MNLQPGDAAIVRTYQDGIPRRENCRIIHVGESYIDVQITYDDGFTCTTTVAPEMVEKVK